MDIVTPTYYFDPDAHMKQPFEVFKALADETRLRILSLLSHGEMCVSDLDVVLQAGQSKVSRHLDYLKKTALVTSRRVGALIFYRLDLERDSMPHRILDVWKEWGQATVTGQRDWEKVQTINLRRPGKSADDRRDQETVSR